MNDGRFHFTGPYAPGNFPWQKLWAYPDPGMLFDFRLTTQSGVAISTSDRTAQGTIYLTPRQMVSGVTDAGTARLALNDGWNWRLYKSFEISKALSTWSISSGQVWDVWAYVNSAGQPDLDATQWTSGTARATALALVDGTLVKSGDVTRRWVGSIRGTGTNTTEDSLAKRFVVPAYWTEWRPMQRLETNFSWTYTSATTIRQANASSSNQVEWLTALPGSGLFATLAVDVQGNASVMLELDGTSAITPDGTVGYGNTSAALPVLAGVALTPGLGYHFLAWCELAPGGTSVTYFGRDTVSSNRYLQSGINAWVRC